MSEDVNYSAQLSKTQQLIVENDRSFREFVVSSLSRGSKTMEILEKTTDGHGERIGEIERTMVSRNVCDDKHAKTHNKNGTVKIGMVVGGLLAALYGLVEVIKFLITKGGVP